MDLANYASELIKQHGELYVPGLGYFARVRKSSYYDPETGTLYPPYFETSFEQHRTGTEENALASYITEQKNISLASASYFLDKFVAKVKHQAETDEVPFADLGYFYTDHQARLAFRPNQLDMHQNASLFGYPPVQFQKIKDLGRPVKPRPVAPPPAPVIEPEPTPEILAEKETWAEKETPAAQRKTVSIQDRSTSEGPVLVTNNKPEEPVNVNAESEDVDDTNEEGLGTASNIRFWTIVIIVVVAAASALIWYYKHRFGNIQKQPAAKHQTVKHVTPAPAAAAKIDTTTKKADTTNSLNSAPTVLSNSSDTLKQSLQSKNAQPQNGQTQPNAVKPAGNKAAQTPPNTVKPADSKTVQTPPAVIPKDSWLIMGGQFNNYDNAVKTLAKYRGLGYTQARMIDSVRHKKYFVYKIIFGFKPTKEEAVKTRVDILKAQKIKPQFIYVQPNK